MSQPQRRNTLLRDTLIAVGVVGIIIFGLIFAILLSSSPDATNPTETVVVGIAGTDETGKTEPTETASLTVTNTATIEIPTTAAPSSEPTASATDTPKPEPSETDEPTATHTEPSRRGGADADVTATNAASDTPQPAATSTSQYASLGIIPTLASPTVFPVDEPTRTPASCDLPRGWTTYTVQRGDTLFAISLATNAPIEELRFANCLDNIDNILAGDIIFVPITPVRPVASLAPTNPRTSLSTIGCTNPNVVITSPIADQRIAGVFTIFGSAITDNPSDFWYYKIEIRPEMRQIYQFWGQNETPITYGELMTVNSDDFERGWHWVKLTLVRFDGSIVADEVCEIPLYFE